MTIWQRYEDGGSCLHRLDARVKVGGLALVLVGIVMTPDGAWAAYPLLWVVMGSLAFIGHIGVGRLGRLAGVALPFALAAVTLLVTTPGHPLAAVAGLTITDAGLGRFVGIVLKSWLSMQAALLFAMSTAFTDLLWALEQLGLPKPLVAIVGYMYRYLFTLREEAERLMRARAARSGSVPNGRTRGRVVWQAQVAGGMVGNLFLRSYERSERVYAAMLARGYQGERALPKAGPPSWRMIGQGAIPVTAVFLIQIAVRL